MTTKTIAGLYDLEETLGKGHFATVKAARHVFTNERVAVKVIDKSKLDAIATKSLLKEVLCMKLVQHPNVVKLYEVIDTSSKLFLVLELGRGDLYDLLGGRGLEDEKAKEYFVQIYQAVNYCHELHVVHRDLKPENVIWFPHSNQVKLTDFGFSNNYSPGVKLDTSCGSLAYSAPEILLGDPYDPPAVDTWSLGVILYTLLLGHPPFQEANDSETLTKIMDVKYTLPPSLPPLPSNLISLMLRRLPEQRIRMEEIMGHGWLRGRSLRSHALSTKTLTKQQIGEIHAQMLQGGVVGSEEEILDALKSHLYNHVTSTYYLLVERLLREKGGVVVGNEELLSASCESLNNLGGNSGGRRVSIEKCEVVEKKFTPICEGEGDVEEEELVAVEIPKRRRFLNWLFRKNNNNNNNRIYKTRSCGELKIKGVN